MQLTKGKAIIIAIIVSAIGIIAGISYFENSQQVDVRLGYLQGDIHHLAFFVAIEKGYYAQEGLKIKTYEFSNGNSVMNAFESATRSIDMSYLGFAPAIVHRINAAGANITVVAGVNANGSALIVRNDNTINNISDLFGKKIAIPAPNNMQDFMLRMILDSDPSVSYDNITTVVMSVSNMPIALKSGSIDGYIAWEPYCAQSVVGDSPSGKYLVNSSAIWPNHPCCVIAAYNSFLKAHPDIVSKVLDVHIKATKFINDPANRDEVVQIAVNRLGISPEIAQLAISNVGYIYEPDKEKMVEFLDKLVTFNTVTFPSQYTPEGMTNRTEFINYFVNTTILDTILAESA